MIYHGARANFESNIRTEIEMSLCELLFYNMRHVQHGAAQLNLILRQKTDSAQSWIKDYHRHKQLEEQRKESEEKKKTLKTWL